MVLRPDEPTLYYYDRATAKDSVKDVQLITLIKIYRLLWIAVVLLAGLLFPAIRAFSFIIAGALLVDLFYRIRVTRKIGPE
jgi:Flp pilus assembly protein TadB